MSIYHHPFPLKCFDIIRKQTSSYMSQFTDDNLYVKNVPLSSDVVELFNQEMMEYGLPPAWSFLAFKRKGFFRKNPVLHIDYSANQGKVYSSIVIPVEGCEGTHMYWMNGNYESEPRTVVGANYLDLTWKSRPILADQVEIYNEPVLTRVDVPHSASSNLDGSYRLIISIRLLGNPSFEEIIQTRFHSRL
jgi:hypothetical protein